MGDLGDTLGVPLKDSMRKGLQGSPHSKQILLVPLTKMDINVLEAIKQHLERLNFNVMISIEEYPPAITEYVWDRAQYNADGLLAKFQNKFKNYPFDAIIGIGDLDAYSDLLNFVFGIAVPKFGLVFTRRLKEEFYNREPNYQLYISRLKKEVTHELGHALGLPHCDTPGCVMNFSNSVKDVDKKGDVFCDKCKRKLNINNES